jgi:hypothetical protein
MLPEAPKISHSGLNIWGITQGKFFAFLSSSDFSNDSQARMNPYPNGQSDTPFVSKPFVQPTHRLKNTKPRSYRTLGIVLMGHRITKVDQ